MSVLPDSTHNLSPSIVGNTPIDEINNHLSPLSLAYCRLLEPAIGGTQQFNTILDEVAALGDPTQGDQYVPGSRHWRVPQHRFAMEAMGLMAVIDLANTEDPDTFVHDSTAMTAFFGWDAAYIGQTIAVASKLSSLDPVAQAKFITDLCLIASGYDWQFRADPGSLEQGVGSTQRGAVYPIASPLAITTGGGFPTSINRLDPSAADLISEVAKLGRLLIKAPSGIDSGVKAGSLRLVAPRGFIFEQDDQSLLAPNPWELITQANTSESIVGAGTNTLTVTWDDTGGGGAPIVPVGADSSIVQFRLVANNRTKHRPGHWVQITGQILGTWLDFADADITSQFRVIPIKVRSELR